MGVVMLAVGAHPFQEVGNHCYYEFMCSFFSILELRHIPVATVNSTSEIRMFDVSWQQVRHYYCGAYCTSTTDTYFS
jgi:hypothetical protein